MHINKKFFLMLSWCIVTHEQAVSIVYNLRISETTRRQQLTQEMKDHNILAATTFGQWRKLKNGFLQSAYGEIGTYIHGGKSYYFKIDGAVARVTDDVLTQTFKATQTDDLLFTGGYSHAVGTYGRFTYSGLLGLPTHRDSILDLVEFGTGHVGLGGQFDLSYAYTHDQSMVILSAVRLVHFFPRNAVVNNPCLQPLYPSREFVISPGNLADIFISHRINWNKVNLFETGYDATFIGFGSRIKPAIVDFFGTQVYIRHSFFGVYSRIIPAKKHPMGIVVGASGGFDSRPRIVGNRYMFTTWILWGVLF